MAWYNTGVRSTLLTNRTPFIGLYCQECRPDPMFYGIALVMYIRQLVWAVLGAAFLVLAPTVASAESATTTQLWTDFIAEWNFKPKHLLELEVGPKLLLSDEGNWQELTITPAYEYSPNNRWDLVSRLLFSWVTQTKRLSTFEVRPVLGFKYYLNTMQGKWMVRDFNRIEARFIRYNELDEWEDTYRYRNRLEAQYAINNDSLIDDRTYYALMDAEVFVNLGRDTVETFNDNWRFRGGIGFRQDWGWRYEFLYTLQLTRDTLADDFNTSNHIFRLRFKHFFK